MEVSSHALAQGRVFGVPYDVAIFTNLTRDHLDFHGTMEAYFAAKRRLFDASLGRAPRVAVVNADDPYGLQLAETARAQGSEVFSYGIEHGDFRAEAVELSSRGMEFRLCTPFGTAQVKTKLIGRVNVYNLLAASAAALARGLTLCEVVSAIATLPSVPGRFQTIDEGQPFAVVVDYAHTEAALRNVISVARELKPRRVLTLFGCGGDRDRSKRPRMGAAAAELSDFVVLTSDNPRSEDPLAIIEEAQRGMLGYGTPYLVEPDRARAIRLVLAEARPGDAVIIAGKGHETYQVLKDRVIPFDDREAARQALQELGYRGGET